MRTSGIIRSPQEQDLGVPHHLDPPLHLFGPDPEQFLDIDLRNGEKLIFDRDDERGDDRQRQGQFNAKY